jgi:hypothetical protein
MLGRHKAEIACVSRFICVSGLTGKVEGRRLAERLVSCYAFAFFAQKHYWKDSRLQNIKFSCVTA